MVAMENEKKESKGKAAEKRIKRIPKVTKTGAAPTSESSNQKEIERLHQKMVKSTNQSEQIQLAAKIRRLKQQQ